MFFLYIHIYIYIYIYIFFCILAYNVRHSINRMLDMTGGKNIHQICLLAGFAKYNVDKSMNLSGDELEKGSYRYRCMVSQLLNHKQNNNLLPAAQQKDFQIIFDKLGAQTEETEKKEDVDDVLDKVRNYVDGSCPETGNETFIEIVETDIETIEYTDIDEPQEEPQEDKQKHHPRAPSS